jgi:cytochrome c oxidase cbb3-type subunit 1
MYPMYVIRALGGGLFLAGALIMCWNLWMTVRAQPVRDSRHAMVPAE